MKNHIKHNGAEFFRDPESSFIWYLERRSE